MDKRIDLEERENLKVQISKKFDSEIKWNSNPSNYDKLSIAIKSKTGRSVGQRFLRDFFWDKKKDKFRLSNVDTLYFYLFNKSRVSFLNKDENEVLYFKGDEIELAQLPKHLKKVNIDTIPIDTIIGSIQQNNIFSHLYINKAILEDKKGGMMLLKLLNDNLTRTLSDIKIQFHFDQKLIDPESEIQIVSDQGRLEYISGWREQIKKLKGFWEDKDDITSILQKGLERLGSWDYFITLKILAEIQIKKLNNLSPDDISVDFFQPFLKEVHHIEPKRLSEIYKSNLNNNNSEHQPFQFLCVIGYKKYLDSAEKKEMIKYFSEFNNSLSQEGHSVTRIFTVPCNSKEGIFSPVFNKHESSILKNYVNINIDTDASVFLFMYDVESIHQLNHMLLYQDYVIRLNKTLNISDSEFADILDDGFAKLYLAYPEDLNGTNQMIEIPIKNEIYKYVEDFKVRMSGESMNYKLIKVNKENKTKIDFHFGSVVD